MSDIHVEPHVNPHTGDIEYVAYIDGRPMRSPSTGRTRYFPGRRAAETAAHIEAGNGGRS